jgi:tetratricopeptide (TPR) repeat protein
VIPAFEQVINRSPRFKGGWARLLLAESEVASNSPPSERKSIEDSLRKHLAAGRKVDATMPEALQAEILLVPARQFTRRMELVNRAVALHPDNAALLTLRSGMLMAVGRMNDAVQDAKHAAEIDVVSPSAEAAYIYALAHSGQTELAKHELRKAQTISPGAASLNEVQFSINLRYGDPAAALQELRTGSFRTQINPASQESFLRARLDPTHENIAHAISDASAVKQQTIRRLIQVLAEFGREQQILDELLKYDANTPEQFTDILFRPKGRALRQDPRFMLVAQRFGLLDYWQRSGKWPDFCSDPDLPYDCKKEAAKIQA